MLATFNLEILINDTVVKGRPFRCFVRTLTNDFHFSNIAVVGYEP